MAIDDKGGIGNASQGGFIVTAPETSDEGQATTDQRKKQSSDLHRILHSAYSFVRSVETNNSISALTLDHLLKEHIQALGSDPEKRKTEKRVMSDATGTGFDSRPSRWDQINEMEKQFNNVIEVIKKAGDDPAKLKALGIYEVDQETTGSQT